jgi:hypothetical protein
MRILRLPAVPQLRNRQLLTRGNEDRVVAETFLAARPAGDAALERAGAAKLAAVRCKKDELGDVARSPILDAVELAEELRDRRRPFRGIARREDTGTAAERPDLQARVLCEHPAARMLATEARFQSCVVVVRLAGLGRVVVSVEWLDRPAGKKSLELTRLVSVA